MLKGKTAIITGTNRGIGKAILEEFSKNGATIFAHARKETPEFVEMIERLSKENNVEIIPLYFDLIDYEAMKNVINNIRKTKKPIDILVNNAGITSNTLFQMTTIESMRQQFETNLFSPIIFTQYILKLMTRENKGNIINIASTSAFNGDIGRSSYGAAKAALVAFTKSIAAELGSKGIRANCIAPGFIDTDMMSFMTEDVINANLEKSSLKRMGTPTDIAKLAVFLASDNSSYITGQTIIADGGLK